MTPLLYLVDMSPRALEAFTLQSVDYEIGDVVPVRVSTVEFHTGPFSYLDRVETLELGDRKAWKSDADGIHFGGASYTEGWSLELDNVDDALNFLRLVSFDGAEVVVREGRAGQALADMPTWKGAGAGMHEIGETVKIPITDARAGDLQKTVQQEKFLGLGGLLSFNGTDEAGTVKAFDQLDQISEEVTVVVLVSWDGAGNAPVLMRDTTLVSPFSIHGITESSEFRWRLRVRCENFETPASDTPTIGAGVFKWLALTYDFNNSSRFTCHWADFDGSNFETLFADFTDGDELLASSANLLLGKGGAEWAGIELGEVRIYNRALTSTELAGTLGRPLEEDELPEVLYLRCDDRLSLWATDSVGDNDAILEGSGILTGDIWSSTKTGEPSQRDSYLPITLGESKLTPGVFLDETLGYWFFGAADVVRVYSSSLVGLTPTYDETRVDFVADADTQTIQAAGADFLAFVPGMQLDLTGWDAGQPAQVTVAAVLSSTRFRVDEVLVDDTPASASLTAVLPAWSVDGQGVVHAPGQHESPLVAWVRGTPDTLGSQLAYILGTIGAALASKEYEGTSGLTMPHMVHLPGEPVKVVDLLKEICEPLSIAWGAEDGETITFRQFQAPADDPAQEYSNAQVEGLEREERKPPPSEIPFGYAPVVYQPSQTAELAHPEALTLATDPYQLVITEAVADLDLWPSAEEAKRFSSMLTQRGDAVDALAVRKVLAGGWLWSAEVQVDDLAWPAVGDEITLTYMPRRLPEVKHQLGFEAGRAAIVLEVEPDMEQRTAALILWTEDP